MSSTPKDKKNSASKSSFQSVRAKSSPKNTGGRIKQKKQSLSKEQAKRIWSEHKKNSEKDFRKKFYARKKYAEDKLEQIKEGKVARSIFSSEQIAYFEGMKKTDYKTYRSTHKTPAEVDEETWDNRIVSPNNPIARTSRRRKTPIPWADDPSKSDFPFIDHPQISSQDREVLSESNYWSSKNKKTSPTDRDFIVYKRELGNQFIDVNDARQLLKVIKFRFDNLFTAKAEELEKEKIISPNERNYFEKTIDSIIRKNQRDYGWNNRMLEFQKTMFNEEKLIKKKLELADSMKEDFGIINSLSQKIKDMDNIQKKSNERELRYLRFGDPKAKELLERIDERKRLEREIASVSDPSMKRSLQNRLNMIIDDNNNLNIKVGHTLSQPSGRNKTFSTKVSDSDYMKILAKAEGVYGKHAFIRDALNRQERYLKSTHNMHILHSRKVPALRGKINYLSNNKDTFENKIQYLENKLKTVKDSKQRSVLISKINNLKHGDQRAQKYLDKIRSGEINPLKKADYEKLNLKALGLEGIKKERIVSALELASAGVHGMDSQERELQKELDKSNKYSQQSRFERRFFVEDAQKRYTDLKSQLDNIRQAKIDETNYITSHKIITPKDFIDYKKELGNWDRLSEEEDTQLKELVSQYQKINTKKNRAEWVSKLKTIESPKVKKNLDIYLLYFSKKAEEENRQLRKGIKMPRSFEKKLTDLETKLQYEMNSDKRKALNKEIDNLMTDVELTSVEKLQFDMSVPPEHWKNYIKERLTYK